MTLKTRNRINLFLIFISLLIIISIRILTPFLYSLNQFTFPTKIPTVLFPNFFLTKFEFIAIIAAINFFPTFSFIIFLYINIEFENTQSTEVIYFSIFLIACLMETFRLLFPYFNLWETTNSLAVYASSIVLFGRILAPLSLLFMVLFNKAESRQYIERNIVLLIVISAYIAMILPLNTSKTLPLGFYDCGYSHLFLYSQIITFVSAIITQAIQTFQDKNRQIITLKFFMICLGYFILTKAHSFLFVILGATLILVGTILYLKNLHSIYLWKN